jgi:hypothetical protein
MTGLYVTSARFNSLIMFATEASADAQSPMSILLCHKLKLELCTVACLQEKPGHRVSWCC